MTDVATPGTDDPARAGFDALVEELRRGGELVRDRDRGAADARGRAAGYAYMTELVRVALDLYGDADGDEPRLVPLSSPTPYHAGERILLRVQGGANPDALYDFAALRADRGYRISGRRGNDCYFSLSFSGGGHGEQPNRTVATLNDRQIAFAPDGSFEVIVSTEEHPGSWVRMEPDVSSMVVRQYFDVPPTARRSAMLRIELLDGRPSARRSIDDPELIARRLTAAAAFVRATNATFPLPAGLAENAFMEPLGYSGEAGALGTTDNVYVMGRWCLEPGQTLVVETTPIECRYWSLQAWNHWGQSLTATLDPAVDYPHQIVSAPTATVRDDGSVRIVLAHHDPGEPNWLDTFGWTRGVMIFRYLYPEAAPARPETRVVTVQTK